MAVRLFYEGRPQALLNAGDGADLSGRLLLQQGLGAAARSATAWRIR